MLRQAFLVGVLSLAFYIFFYVYTTLGFNYHFHKHYPGDCRQVSGIEFGSENMQVTESGLAFITSGVNYQPMPAGFHEFLKRNNIRGQIFLFDFKQPQLGARSLKIQKSKAFDQETFQPHGISVLEDKEKGEHLLYVVNHPRGGNDRIEKFRFNPKVKELQHIRFFNSSMFHITNDLAMVSEDKFYISDYLYFNSPFMSQLENMLPMHLGSLLFVDGDKVTEVVAGLNSPNGVTLSKDQRFLYVALPLSATIHVYERQKDNGLKLVQDVSDSHTLVDNFHLTQEGDALLTGAHPIAHRAFSHLADPTNSAPSSVVRFPLSKGRVVVDDITELFYDHGDMISASTIAAIHSNQLLIGSIIDKLVVCDLYVRPNDPTSKGK